MQIEKLIPRDPDFKQRIEDKLTRQHFMHHIGFEIDIIEPGRVEGGMKLAPYHRQQFDILHGGVVSTIADIVAGFAAYTLIPKDRDVVTGEIKISYFRAGFGDHVRAIAQVVKPGKHISFVEAEVYQIAGEKKILVAKATTTMAIIDRNR